MLRKFVGFYWTLPVIRRDFRYLPYDIDEAARKSRTIRYQRELATRYVKKVQGKLIHELAFIDSSADRATERIYKGLRDARQLCDEHDAKLVYVNFSERNNWRPILGLRSILSSWGDDRAVGLSPDRLLIDGANFDPITHFQDWRKLDGKEMAELETAADQGLKDAFAQFPKKHGRWKKMAGWLNERKIRSYNGLDWTADNVRKAVERRKADDTPQSN